MKSQNFRSSQYEYWSSLKSVHADVNSGNVTNPWKTWVSHKSHRNQIIPVDHVFFSNPADQEEAMLPPSPNWTNLVFREVSFYMNKFYIFEMKIVNLKSVAILRLYETTDSGMIFAILLLLYLRV